MKYYVIISDSINVRGYISDSRNALKHAYKLEHANDTVTVLSAAGKVLSRVAWDCQSDKYIRVFPDGAIQILT